MYYMLGELLVKQPQANRSDTEFLIMVIIKK
jgi:hypothetical protein